MQRSDLSSTPAKPASKLGFRRGYQLPDGTKTALKKFMITDLRKSIAASVFDLVMILILSVSGVVAFDTLPRPLAFAFQFPIFLMIARYQRACESMVHEAGHWNWCRSRPFVNDLLGNLLAAFPILLTVGRYRDFHNPHHLHLGDLNRDTDLQRYLILGVEGLDRRNPAKFLLGMLRVVPRYSLLWRGYLGTNPRVLAFGAAWHLLVVILPLSLMFGPTKAMAWWATYWLLPFAVFLPMIRFIGETGEHVYKENQTIFDSTVSNIGRVHRWFTNPHNDGYHVLHHLYPSFPHHGLPMAHAWLVKVDPEGYGRLHRRRTAIFEDPKP